MTPRLALLLLALACGDDSSSCELPPGRYAVHLFDPANAEPDRDFVVLNEEPTSCHGQDTLPGVVVDVQCSEVGGGQFYCSGESYTAAMRWVVEMRGPI
jgi:hypothetical protein